MGETKNSKNTETVDGLRRLIAQYRERLEAGESSDMVIFCIEGIKEAERKLAEIEKRNKARVPRGPSSD